MTAALQNHLFYVQNDRLMSCTLLLGSKGACVIMISSSHVEDHAGANSYNSLASSLADTAYLRVQNLGKQDCVLISTTMHMLASVTRQRTMHWPLTSILSFIAG